MAATSVFCLPFDLEDEGHDTVLGRIRAAGVDGITVAAAYHDHRDVLPHNPRRKVRYGRGGGALFRPDPSRYRGLPLAAQPHPDAGRADPLADACAAARRHGASVTAWVVYLHDDRQGSVAPGCTVCNAYGDRYLHTLCPLHPDVRAYARALTADVARYPVDAILAEALHPLPFAHGAHHERCFVALDADARWLLGVCFCAHCRAAAGARGVDGDALAAAVRERLDGAFAGEPAGTPPGLEPYLAAQADAVTQLAAELAEVARVPLRFLDPSLAVATEPWRLALQPDAIARHCEVEIAGYVSDPERLRAELGEHRVTPGVVLQSLTPDPAFARLVAVALEAGAPRVGFYAYGLAPLRALDWIREALAA